MSPWRRRRWRSRAATRSSSGEVARLFTATPLWSWPYAMVDACAQGPVMQHGQGSTHVFVDKSADPMMAERIVLNAKTQRPGVCNALETLLVHQDLIASGALKAIAEALVRSRVELRADPEGAKALQR